MDMAELEDVALTVLIEVRVAELVTEPERVAVLAVAVVAVEVAGVTVAVVLPEIGKRCE